MLRQAALRAAHRQVLALPRTTPAVQTFSRSFGAVTEKKVERPFKGASPSEPDMEYVEEPSMLYMTGLCAVPLVFQFWICTRFV
mmetsp:Transcript_32673/g.59373  ORF Transcript_32673/g.59373 Transcript_32673/m.59373 type:complete len:84 (-) Transcript_32673:108-359(-)